MRCWPKLTLSRGKGVLRCRGRYGVHECGSELGLRSIAKYGEKIGVGGETKMNQWFRGMGKSWIMTVFRISKHIGRIRGCGAFGHGGDIRLQKSGRAKCHTYHN